MKKWRKTILLLAAVIVAGGALLWFTREREPSYAGRSLSEWVTLYSAPRGKPNQESGEAIRHIGTNALPWLLAWMDYEPSRLSVMIANHAEKLPKWIREAGAIMSVRLGYYRALDRWSDAPEAFEALGRLAAPAVPELIRRINEADSDEKAGRAMMAMAYIGPEAAPELISILSSPELEANGWALECIRIMGANARPLVPVLVQRLQSTNEPAAYLSAFAVESFKLDAELIVPALAKALNDPRCKVQRNAAQALGEFGKLARPALSALTNALSDPDAHLRSFASNAIWRITTWTPSDTQLWVPK